MRLACGRRDASPPRFVRHSMQWNTGHSNHADGSGWPDNCCRRHYPRTACLARVTRTAAQTPATPRFFHDPATQQVEKTGITGGLHATTRATAHSGRLLRARAGDPDTHVAGLGRQVLRHHDARAAAFEPPGARLHVANLVHAEVLSSAGWCGAGGLTGTEGSHAEVRTDHSTPRRIPSSPTSSAGVSGASRAMRSAEPCEPRHAFFAPLAIALQRKQAVLDPTVAPFDRRHVDVGGRGADSTAGARRLTMCRRSSRRPVTRPCHR